VIPYGSVFKFSAVLWQSLQLQQQQQQHWNLASLAQVSGVPQ
jgi:hypothetical protein